VAIGSGRPRYPCCLARVSPLTVLDPTCIGPACICCCGFLRWNRQATSRFPRLCHLSACPSHFQLFAGSASARLRYIISMARQSATSLIRSLLGLRGGGYRIGGVGKKGRIADYCRRHGVRQRDLGVAQTTVKPARFLRRKPLQPAQKRGSRTPSILYQN